MIGLTGQDVPMNDVRLSHCFSDHMYRIYRIYRMSLCPMRLVYAYCSMRKSCPNRRLRLLMVEVLHIVVAQMLHDIYWWRSCWIGAYGGGTYVY
jgi:hypothetical protein